jgi:enoyl-CoA hydratase
MSDLLLTDDPAPSVRRLTLNRPDKRNALSNELRLALFEALRAADSSEEVSVIIVRGAGPSFCAGYDLGEAPFPAERSTAQVDGWLARHVVAGWLEMWDMATPIIAQVHGYCLAGGSELAAACDLVYVAEDAQIGYPPVRTMSPPDFTWQPWFMGLRRAMEVLLTGDAISGAEAVQYGFANRAFPVDRLDDEVLAVARRITLVPRELLALNKRAVHRSMEAAGIRTGVRAGADIQALAVHGEAYRHYLRQIGEGGLGSALETRDRPFGDYRGGRSGD